jgi:hypothetical protein
MDAKMTRRTFAGGSAALGASQRLRDYQRRQELGREERPEERFMLDVKDLLEAIAQRTLSQYPETIPAFIEDVLGFRMWPVQREIAEAVETKRAVAVRSCHAAGKSAITARIVPAFLHTRDPSIVVTTAPTNRQVQHILWRYIITAVKGS